MPFQERRKHPRVSKNIPCELVVGSSTYTAQTKNLSCGGALCELPQIVPVMTKLGITFNLPALSQGAFRRAIRCVGVVVRQEPHPNEAGSNTYLTAIYFSELSQDDRKQIAEFVLQSMLSK